MFMVLVPISPGFSKSVMYLFPDFHHFQMSKTVPWSSLTLLEGLYSCSLISNDDIINSMLRSDFEQLVKTTTCTVKKHLISFCLFYINTFKQFKIFLEGIHTQIWILPKGLVVEKQTAKEFQSLQKLYFLLLAASFSAFYLISMKRKIYSCLT